MRRTPETPADTRGPLTSGWLSAVFFGLFSAFLTGCMHTTMPFEGLVTACPASDNPNKPDATVACENPPPVAPPPDEIQAVFDHSVGSQPDKAALRTPVPGAPARGAKAEDRSPNSVPRSAPVVHNGTLKLADAVAYGVMTYPEIRVSEERVREARAAIDISKAGLYPSADLRLAGGQNFSGSYQGKAVPYTIAGSNIDKRFDGGLILRQLAYDFGATHADIDRASFLRDAERHKLQEKIDEIAAKIALLFIRIHEQRALLRLVDDTVASHQNLLGIVMAQEKEGQGTTADVSRVKSRLVDVGAIRADISLQLMAAEDQFERLTRNRPTKLGDVPNYRTKIPFTPDMAIEKVLAKNPRLAAMEATRKSAEKELESQRANQLPRFGIEIDTESKNYRNPRIGRTEVEGRALLAMRFRIFDGGLAEATERQIEARIKGNELSLLNEREQFEADIRQAYRAIESANRKMRLIADGVNSARSVRELYLEQFKAGKRTIFELLDGQMAFYTSRRAQIESQFDAVRAVYDILRATGDLTRTLAQAEPAPMVKVEKAARK